MAKCKFTPSLHRGMQILRKRGYVVSVYISAGTKCRHVSRQRI